MKVLHVEKEKEKVAIGREQLDKKLHPGEDFHIGNHHVHFVRFGKKCFDRTGQKQAHVKVVDDASGKEHRPQGMRENAQQKRSGRHPEHKSAEQIMRVFIHQHFCQPLLVKTRLTDLSGYCDHLIECCHL